MLEAQLAAGGLGVTFDELKQKGFIKVPAMVTRLSGDDGFVNQDIRDRYVRYAQGGVGLIVVEAMAVHDAKSGPQLEAVYQGLAPWAELLLRLVIGLALVPHGLRMTFGFFPNTGVPLRNLSMLAKQLDRDGYRPGKLWAPLISATELVGGPFLAIGLFTRLAAVPIVIFLAVSCVERWRIRHYFWNTLGLEYTLMWMVAALYFLIHGGGVYSMDHLVLGREF